MKHQKDLVDKILLYIILIVTSTIGLVLFIPILLGVYFGDYGSFVGGLLGTLIGGVTVYLVYRTYRLQQDELKMSREELVLTRKELELTRGQLGIQNFEVTFFNMLTMFSKISDGIKISDGEERDLFKTGIEMMNDLYHGHAKNSKGRELLLNLLSTFELVLLFYHCIISTTNADEASDISLFNHVKEYGMVEDVDETLMLSGKHYELFLD
jgi:hypothetical protein